MTFFGKINSRHLLPDIGVMIVASYLSLYLRVGQEGLPQFLSVLHRHLPMFVALRVVTFAVMGVYRIIWRYISVRDAMSIGRAVLVSTTLIIASSYVVDVGRLPRATFFIEALLLFVMLSGVRLLRRLRYEYSFEREVRMTGRPTLVYGAGTNGRMLAQRLSLDSDSAFSIMGFIDDNHEKIGRTIHGHKVLGGRAELDQIIRSFEIKELIVSPAKLEPKVIIEIVQVARAHGIQPRVLSTFSRNDIGQEQSLRSVELGDLLNRPRRILELAPVRDLIQGKRILVTGAGGSIGSELARQILGHQPAKLILCDHSEFSLYQIDQQLGHSDKTHRGVVTPLLADIKIRETLEKAFREFRPEVVIHAAAYKHVHLVEANPFPSILNNVLGTRNLLELSRAFSVETFLLISTDKAVNPGGIMGATKRICELMVAAAGLRTGRRYCAVRFGNVLGSSGSLIPLLSGQIEHGGPMTITHPDAARFFMLISEAVSLVLKAAALARPGDISILDMGEPVKILDVAKALVALLGKKEGEIPIVFTGLRPGEKLFEELYIRGNELTTEDPNILVLPRGAQGAADAGKGLNSFDDTINELIDLSLACDSHAIQLMYRTIREHAGGTEELPGTPSFAPAHVAETLS